LPIDALTFAVQTSDGNIFEAKGRGNIHESISTERYLLGAEKWPGLSNVLPLPCLRECGGDAYVEAKGSDCPWLE